MALISATLTILPKHRPLSQSSLLVLKPCPGIQRLSFPRISGKIWKSRSSYSVTRATIDISGPPRPGSFIESDKLPTDVRNRTMDAIDAFGRRVTIGDVASKAGLKLNEAQKALQALAADTDGFLEVSDEGDVLYVFPKDYRGKLAAKSFKLKVEPFFDKAKAATEYVVRVSFGTALIASIVLVSVTIISILSSSRSDDNDRGRRGSRSNDMGFNFFFSPTDLFWYWDPYHYRRRRVEVEEDDKMNFIESVFSFVFGDGDPNQGIEEKRWKMIGQYISSNGGVVTAEELAPYLDLQTADRTMSDESYVLPVLLRFDGEPEIDEEGNIVYRFPSLQRTASSTRNTSGRKENVGKRWADWVGGVEKIFKENKWEFSKTKVSERAMVAGLGAINLSGVLILGTLLKEYPVTQSGFIRFVAGLFPLLQVYAGSFFAIPLIRWFIIRNRNAEIERRNRTREQYARMLESPDLSLRRKLVGARDMAQKTVIGQDRIVYSTDRDLVDQDYEAQEWVRRFREREKSE